MALSNLYLALGSEFSEQTSPDSVPSPSLMFWNQELADELGIDSLLPDQGQAELTASADLLASCFAGNTLLRGSTPIAMAYAGHQFGHFVPQLGDGRAHLLGEVTASDGKILELQLKGSGRSRFSRGGDGRCALGPAVREYIMSEALFALGVPTARSLAVVASGETVYRERAFPGAIVTRVAQSHIRVGTFAYFAARRDTASIKKLCKFSMLRHDPDLAGDDEELTLQFLERVIERQILLISEWMRIGFIHGVMNTDNTAISGETIDFGPCAMMGHYSPTTVFSSIDHHGRYAFGNQANIMAWNMARFAECLIPLLSGDQDRAVELASAKIQGIAAKFQDSWLQMMGKKLGLSTPKEADLELIQGLLEIMETKKLDYTESFRQLSQFNLANAKAMAPDSGLKLNQEIGAEWLDRWQARLLAEDGDRARSIELMKAANPVVIPRNHLVENALKEVESSMDPSAIEELLTVLKTPYDESPETTKYQDPPEDLDCEYQTFCGT